MRSVAVLCIFEWGNATRVKTNRGEYKAKHYIFFETYTFATDLLKQVFPANHVAPSRTSFANAVLVI